VLIGGFKGTSTKGLWGLVFGNNGAAGSSSTLFFTAGINDEQDGLLGSLTATSFSTANASSIALVNPGGGGGTAGGALSASSSGSASSQLDAVFAGDLSSLLSPTKKARSDHASLDAAIQAIGSG
jgi:hypothetical protein